MLDCLDWKICFPSFKILKVESPALDYVITTFFLAMFKTTTASARSVQPISGEMEQQQS